MPPLPVITDTYRVALNWTAGAQTAVNVLHFRDSLGTHNSQELFDDLDANVSANMWVLVGSAGAIDVVTITPLDGVTASSEFSTGVPARWSGQSGEMVPQASALVKHTTAVRGRSGRGRTYLPWLREASQSEGSVVGTGLADAQLAWTTFVVDMALDEWDLVVASYQLAEANTVLTTLVETKSGTQRRRQGRNRA